MSAQSIPLLSAIRTKLKWHQARQRVLAENVANADTPHFTAKDLKQPSFRRELSVLRPPVVEASQTHPTHIFAKSSAPRSPFRQRGDEAFEITPDGNAVSLEEQMMKVTANQMDFQTATTLYSRGLGILKTAIGKR